MAWCAVARPREGSKRLMRKELLAAFIAIAAFASPAGAKTVMHREPVAQRVINVSTHGQGATAQRITLALDKAALVQLDAAARDVLVSNPQIVDAVVRTPRRIFLLAMKTGQTNAFFFAAAGHQLLAIPLRVRQDRRRPCGGPGCPTSERQSDRRAGRPGGRGHRQE